MTVTFELGGQQFVALDGRPNFKFTEQLKLNRDPAELVAKKVLHQRARFAHA